MSDSPARPPAAAMALALAGLLPLVWGLIAYSGSPLGEWTARNVSPRLTGPFVQLAYGSVILAFTSGILWGFAARAEGREATGAYGLSVLPALWAFFAVGGGAVAAAWNLIFGFAGVLLLDAVFQHRGLAPRWWLNLRVPLTLMVVLCLFLGAMR